MKKSFKRLVSYILVIAMVLSLFSALTFSAGAATFSYNTGKRGTVCTSLSSKATAYYTSSYSYSTLSTKSASALKSSLKTLMTNTHTYKTTYTNLKTYTKYSDANAGSSSKIVDFYTSATYSGTWDNGVTWNREHVWCQSLGSFTTSNCGSDLHHLRPTDPKVNSTRSNLPFGEVSGSYKTATTKSGVVGGYYTSTTFEPLDNVKGDVARILLYCYVRWGESNLSDLIDTTTLLNWCKSDPVDTWEMGRNDVVQGIQGNRNVFIDYPEYAWLIFGKSVPSHTTPSGMAKGGSTSGGSTGSGSTDSGSTGSGSTGSGSTGSGSTGSTSTSGTYTKVTSTSQLTAGAKVVFVASNYNYAMSTTQNTNNRGRTSITKSGNTVTINSSTEVFTVGKSGSYYTFYDTSAGGYLRAASSSGNYLRTGTLDNNAKWSISFSSGVAKLTAQGSYSRKYMRYNSSSGIFGCYSSNSSQTGISIYILN